MVLTHNHALFHTYLFCLSVVGVAGRWRGVGGSGCFPKHMHALLFLSLTHRVNRDHDGESPYPRVTTQSTASFWLLRGYFLFHSEVVKMHKHRGHGTVTHWPTSTKEKVFFPALINTRGKNKGKGKEGSVKEQKGRETRTIDLCKRGIR